VLRAHIYSIKILANILYAKQYSIIADIISSTGQKFGNWLFRSYLVAII